MERIRTMARTIKANQAYSLRGEQHASALVEHLKCVLNPKGVEVKRCIITNVVLDKEIADSMQEKTIF